MTVNNEYLWKGFVNDLGTISKEDIIRIHNYMKGKHPSSARITSGARSTGTGGCVRWISYANTPYFEINK